MKIYASERLSEHKYKTPEGYLICTDAILARTGKQSYTMDELLGNGDNTRIDVDRPYNEVFDSKTLASFENKPVTVEHPHELVNAENYKDYAVGYVRDVKQGKTSDGHDVILGNLVITDQKTIDEIESGEHTNLSCGYDCDVVNDGSNGYMQKNIRGNHVALCECPRAGITKIVDSFDDSATLYELSWHAPTGQTSKIFRSKEEAIRYAKMISGSNKFIVPVDEYGYERGEKEMIDCTEDAYYNMTDTVTLKNVTDHKKVADICYRYGISYKKTSDTSGIMTIDNSFSSDEDVRNCIRDIKLLDKNIITDSFTEDYNITAGSIFGIADNVHKVVSVDKDDVIVERYSYDFNYAVIGQVKLTKNTYIRPLSVFKREIEQMHATSFNSMSEAINWLKRTAERNARLFGKNARLSGKKDSFDDAAPGVDEAKYEEVLRYFNGRTPSKSELQRIADYHKLNKATMWQLLVYWGYTDEFDRLHLADSTDLSKLVKIIKVAKAVKNRK